MKNWFSRHDKRTAGDGSRVKAAKGAAVAFRVFLAAAAAAAVVLASCSSSDVFMGEMTMNKVPEIELTSGPLQGDTTAYSVHFYWIGEDADGAVDHYEFCMVEGDPIGFDPADTTGSDKWHWTELTDSVFMVTVEDYDHDVVIDNSLYGQYQKTYTFFIKAIDNRGAASRTIYRSFTAFTLAPIIYISSPRFLNPDLGAQILSTTVTFKWYGKDPIDTPWNYQEVDSTRYLWASYNVDLLAGLNSEPEKYESMWSKWQWFHAEGDSGMQTILGDDEFLVSGDEYMIAIQAKDEAGAVTSIFDKSSNVRHFRAMRPVGPTLWISDPFVPVATFVGLGMPKKTIELPPSFETNFRWQGDASSYGGQIQSYRYGWDIVKLDDPNEWEVAPSPFITSAIPRTFFSGVHTLYVEAADNLGTKTLGVIEMSIIPIVMSRNLLLVDDFPSLDFVQTLYAFPTETEHDRFWNRICLKVKDFDIATDVYDLAEHAYMWPPMRMLWQYKNIIWTFSKAIDPITGSAWNKLIYYQPPGSVSVRTLNFLIYYLRSGGHLWTVGEGHRTGNLSSCLPGMMSPCYLRCEYYGPSTGCDNTIGSYTMAYNDFCVSVLDKADGIFNLSLGIERTTDWDASKYMRLDDKDPLVHSMIDPPKRLELWDVVTQPGAFFDPAVRGFHYPEFYDVSYYLGYVGAKQQSCIHPMYRSVALNSRSVVNNATTIFLHDKYASVVAPAPGCIGAPSVHCGFPLWFFDRGQVDSLATSIFRMWQIDLIDQ